MSIYSVWTQIVDDDTGMQNLDDYGSVHDVFAEQENDDTGTPNKQFCDGQTSKTPPRYAQDNMVGIYTRSEDAARIISGFLREDVAARIQAGTLRSIIPSWYTLNPDLFGVLPAREARQLTIRMLYQFPNVPEADIVSNLDAILANGIDKVTVESIIKQMRGRLNI